MVVIRVKGAHVEFRVETNHVREWVIVLLYSAWKWSKIMHYCQIQRNFRDSEYLCKFPVKNNRTDLYSFSRHNLQNFDTNFF